jgi:phosphoribosyl 1,2-cyclic phosphate phosphodiesterase
MLGHDMMWSKSGRKTVTDSNRVRVEILGTGTSTGVPVLNCPCEICTSNDPRDKRLRCSVFVQAGGVNVLIDTGPDFRQQAFRAGIEHIDAVLITHHHFDHVVGMDDLRPFLLFNRSPIPIYAEPGSADVLRSMFSYIFRDGSYPGVPRLEMNEIRGPFEVASREDNSHRLPITPIPAVHGSLDMLGFRIGGFAYLTDVSEIPNASFALLEDLDVLVLDALRDRPHPMHLTIDQAKEVAGRIGARQTYFTHMSHEILHVDFEKRVGEGMAPAFDGLVFEAGL